MINDKKWETTLEPFPVIKSVIHAEAEITKVCALCGTNFILGEDLIMDDRSLIVVEPCKCYACEESEETPGEMILESFPVKKGA